MTFYASPQYATTYYGSDEFGNPSGGPANLNAYQNNIETVVLYWTLEPASPSFNLFNWTVQTDMDPTFGSPQLITYDGTNSEIALGGPLGPRNVVSVTVDGFPVSSTFDTDTPTTLGLLATAIAARPNVASAIVMESAIVVSSINTLSPVSLTAPSITFGGAQAAISVIPALTEVSGRVNKGAAVPIYPRAQGKTQTMYWRVMGTLFNSPTIWANSTFTIPQATDGVDRDAMIARMPDPVYKKDPGSNNYGMLWSYGQSLDELYIEYFFANNDISIALCRDATIQKKFGNMVGITQPGLMKSIDYREILRQFYVEARNSPALRSVINVTEAALGVAPTIVNIRDVADSYVADGVSGEVVDGIYLDDNLYPAIAPATVWNNVHLAGGVIVEVTDPLGAIVSRDFLQLILRKLVLANCPLYVIGIA